MRVPASGRAQTDLTVSNDANKTSEEALSGTEAGNDEGGGRRNGEVKRQRGGLREVQRDSRTFRNLTSENGSGPRISCAKWLLIKMTQFSPSTHPSSWPQRKWQTPSSTGQQSNARRSTKTAIYQLRRLPVAESDFIRSSGPCRRSCCTRRSRGSTLSAPTTPKTGTHLSVKFETYPCRLLAS